MILIGEIVPIELLQTKNKSNPLNWPSEKASLTTNSINGGLFLHPLRSYWYSVLNSTSPPFLVCLVNLVTRTGGENVKQKPTKLISNYRMLNNI